VRSREMRLETRITAYLMASLFCAPLLGQQSLETVEVIGVDTPRGSFECRQDCVERTDGNLRRNS